MDQMDGSEYSGLATDDPDFCCYNLDEWPDNFNTVETWSPGYGNNPFNSFGSVIYIDQDVTIP